MAMHLGESTVMVMPVPSNPNTALITKKISNYIFKFEDKIGQGNFSKVYKGYHQVTNQQVAIKIIQLSSIQSAKLQELLFSEIEVIQSLHHPNILKCYEVLKSEHNCYIITELCNGGDLQSLLKKQKCLNQISAAPYIRDIYRGLLYLGQRGIVHRDLKSANIFLHNGVCKIADFGFAKYTNNQNFYDLDIGSPLYMSPQGMISNMYGMKTDIWAFGIIIYELLHGQTPYVYCNSEYDLKRAVSTPLQYNSIRPDLPNDVKQLILKCLIVDSKHRPDAISLKNDPYLYQIMNSKIQQPHYVKIVESSSNYGSQNYVQVNTTDQYITKTSSSNSSNQNICIHHTMPLQQQVIPLQQQIIPGQQQISNHDVMHQMNVVHYHNPQPTNMQYYYPQNQPHIHKQNQPHIHIQNQPHIHIEQPHIHIEPHSPHSHVHNQSHSPYSHVHIDSHSPHSHLHVQPQPHIKIQHHQIPQQQYMPIQYSSNSPVRIININGNSSRQISLKGSKKNQTIHLNQISSGRILTSTSSTNIIHPHSHQNIQRVNHVYTEQIPTLYPKRTDSDTILIPEQNNDKEKHSGKDNNFDKVSNSSWSHDNVGRQPFNKSSSHQHIHMLQNNLVVLNSHHPKVQGEGPKVVMRTLSTNDRPHNQYQPYRVNQRSNLQHTYSYQQYQQQKQDIKNQSLTHKNINQSSHHRLNIKQQGQKSNKKFGQIIKKDKKTDSNVKSTIKLQQIVHQDQQPVVLQRSKTKSSVNIDQVLMTRASQSPSKRRPHRLSYGEAPSNRQLEGGTQNQGLNSNKNSLKVLIEQKKGLSRQLNRNIIIAIMQFKESVGFLHYCRLYNRFSALLRRMLLFPQIQRYQILSKIFKNSEIHIQTYSRYLLTSLNQLIQNIRGKQIIYDGNDYKKKKLKEDKLRQVSEQYYKKYQQQINKNRIQNNKIVPSYTNSTRLLYIQQYNEKFWEDLDKGYDAIMHLIKNGHQFGDNFMKNYRNLCYLALRIAQANQIILTCVSTKSYKLLGDVLIENWLQQQSNAEQIYFQLRNQYINSNLTPSIKTTQAAQTLMDNQFTVENQYRVESLPKHDNQFRVDYV